MVTYRWTDQQTDRQTHKPSTVTFTVYVRQGLFMCSICMLQIGSSLHVIIPLTQTGVTPLYIASGARHSAIANILIRNGADVNLAHNVWRYNVMYTTLLCRSYSIWVQTIFTCLQNSLHGLSHVYSYYGRNPHYVSISVRAIYTVVTGVISLINTCTVC